MSDNHANPRPKLPFLPEKSVPGSSESSSGIRLPPISFLSNVSQLPTPQLGAVPRLLNEPPKDGPLPSLQPLSQLTSSSAGSPPSSTSKPPVSGGSFSFSVGGSSTSTLPLKEDLTKPEVDSESDEEIIKYYENKYGITDFTLEEKHDILQHERRARIEKKMNPNYRTYLCYSIIKRLNTMKDPKKDKPFEPIKSEPTFEKQTQLPLLQASQQSPLATVTQLPVDKAETETEAPPVNPDSTTIQADATVIDQESSFAKPPIVVKNDDVLDYASKFPRKHIGSLIYNPAPTKSSYKQLSLFKDLKVTAEQDTKIVTLLPELRDYINCLVTVRVPSWQITDLQNNKHYLDRAIWGTDIYTDDSDILLILKHNGFLPQVDPDIEGEEKTMEKRTPGNKDNVSNITQGITNFRQFINIIGGDVHVDLIILPPLVEYAGVFRNGVNSRGWRGHDGMSIAIHGVRYGEKGSAVESINAPEVRKRKLAEIEALKNSEKSQGQWRLNKEAWKKAKMDMELEKNKEKGGEKKKGNEENEGKKDE